MTDTTRWDMLTCYRDVGLRTPHLDRLAAEGVRFARAYTTSPVCGPARAALLTGVWSHGNGGWTTGLALGEDQRTIGQRVRDAGVHTGYIGKWHLDGTDYFGNGRCPDGWDPRYWFDGRSYLDELSPADRRRSRNPDAAVESEFTYAHRCTDRAVDFLDRYGRGDFLLVVSYDEPHDPSLSPEPYSSMYSGFRFPDPAPDSLADKPAHHRVWAASAHPPDTQRFLGALTYVDAQIGRVLAAVDAVCPDALVLYTSDHGIALGAHGLDAKGPAMYDEIARVPLLARWPGIVPPGTVVPGPASHIDVAPTILEALGCPIPPYVDGRSMVPTLRDPVVSTRDAAFCEFGRYELDHDGFGGFQPLRGVFDGRYKLVLNLLTTDELYDVWMDPDELVNLVASPAHHDVRDRLHDRILDWMHDSRDPFRGYYWARRPWRIDAPPASWRGRGMTRQREDDGYQPRMLDYTTGLPMTEPVRPKP